MTQYNLVVCGGTFDHFHKGHKHFLLYIFSIAKEVLIGVTTDGYVNAKKNDNNIEPFDVRKASLEQFLRQEGLISRAIIAAIDSVFYPHDWEVLPIDAIVVTKESVEGADIINQDRKKKSLRSLHVVISDMEVANDGVLISSSRIRKGQINREGRTFVKKEWVTDTLLLPDHLRDVFQKPFGTLITHVTQEFLSSYNPSRIITVGDIATKTFLDMGISQKLAVIDYFVERKKRFKNLSEHGFLGHEKVFDVVNPASKISPQLVQTLKTMFSQLNIDQTLVCRVDGEEDLAVLPVLLLSPLGYHVFYGQPPGKGIVRIDVTEDKKEEAYKLAERFILRK